MRTLLALNISDGTVVGILGALSIAMLIYLACRRTPARRIDDGLPSRAMQNRRWMLRLAAGAAGGAIVGVVIILVAEVWLDLFGTPLEADTHAWIIVTFVAIGIAVVNLWTFRWWRKSAAGLAIVLFAATATVGINQSYGLNPTLASLMDINITQHLTLPVVVATGSPAPTASVAPPLPLWQSWTPPAGMPATGRFGTVSIPNTASGFVARPATLYLPPAALVANPPALPILIMMMGQPGGPDSSSLFLPSLNAAAAAHRGLGPIVLTIDQIGSPTQNPLCIDSVLGKVHTYVMTDVVNYVRANLHVASDRQDWAVGGYSNGGECAMSLGAKHPDVFGSILDISGEIGPDLGSPAVTIQRAFGGDTAKYDAELPLTIMKQTHYVNMLAIFTSGSKDPYYSAEVAETEAAAKAAGMVTHREVGTGIGHRSDAISYGFPIGLPLLYPRWQLESPQ